MRLLIDTHVLVCMTLEKKRVSACAHDALTDPDNAVFVSPASAYEIEFKRERDEALQRMPPDLREAVSLLRYEWLAITREDAIAAGRLPRHHGDPWDRVLVAQAQRADLTLVTKDPLIARYDVPTMW